MTAEIDQSGKVEQLNTDTIVAFSNGISGAILCTVATKRRIYQYLRKSLIPSENLASIIFSTLVFILLFSVKTDSVNIDEEYTGKGKIIEETLSKLYSRKGTRKNAPEIHHKRIGKLSNAHKLAWKLHRSKKRGGLRKITEIEVIKLIEGK